ncbi:hypothetical protein T492DRAFT_863417 [Pavlovales sp. CCMP2436]|nr:hypothetical protein T492DRAFT_863417 [Pavlovales sp. CCMP2436]
MRDHRIVAAPLMLLGSTAHLLPTLASEASVAVVHFLAVNVEGSCANKNWACWEINKRQRAAMPVGAAGVSGAPRLLTTLDLRRSMPAYN